MKLCCRMRKREENASTVLYCVCVWAFVFLLATANTVQAKAFEYTAENTPLPVLLNAFAQSEGKVCEVSPSIQGNISGDLRFANVQEFFTFLERNQSIVAYQNTSGVYFYPRSEMQSDVFSVRNIGISTVRQALEEMGVYDRRYPLQWVSGGRLLKLTAPPPYVDLVAEVLMSLEQDEPPVKRGTKVFRLKHAWADDITLNFMDKEVLVPGVASLLRNLTGGDTIQATPTSQSRPAVQRLKGQGLMRRTGTQTPQTQNGRPPLQRGGMQESAGNDAPENVQKQNSARIMADSRLNAVVVWDDLTRMPQYQELVDALDVAAGLVEIRAAIIDVSVNKMQELGISWGYNRQKTGDGLSVIGGANVTSTAEFQNMAGAGLNVSTIFVNGIDMLMNRIHALEQQGDASVLSRPAVLTMDNIQAILEVTNTFYVQVPGTYEVDLFDVTYGTVLRVTPHIVKNDTGAASIKLVVHIEDGGTRMAPKDSGLTLPVVSRTTISTQAVVGESQALIIGGHYYESNTTGENGVPVLMNVPILGALFKDQNDTRQKQERLFIISPRLVDIQDVPARMNAITQEQQTRLQKNFDPVMMTPPAPRAGCSRTR